MKDQAPVDHNVTDAACEMVGRNEGDLCTRQEEMFFCRAVPVIRWYWTEFTH